MSNNPTATHTQVAKPNNHTAVANAHFDRVLAHAEGHIKLTDRELGDAVFDFLEARRKRAIVRGEISIQECWGIPQQRAKFYADLDAREESEVA